MKITIESADKLKQIESLLEQASELYKSIPNVEQEQIFEQHLEAGSLPYCLRWGLQAARELIE